MPCLAEVLAEQTWHRPPLRPLAGRAANRCAPMSASRNRIDHMPERRSGATLQPGQPGARVSACRHVANRGANLAPRRVVIAFAARRPLI